MNVNSPVSKRVVTPRNNHAFFSARMPTPKSSITEHPLLRAFRVDHALPVLQLRDVSVTFSTRVRPTRLALTDHARYEILCSRCGHRGGLHEGPRRDAV